MGFSGRLSVWVFKLSCDEAGERASLEEQVELAAWGECNELRRESDDADKGEEDYG